MLHSMVVASFTDAWIETWATIARNDLNTSHLLQMRGLKPLLNTFNTSSKQSHLLQMRGLKHHPSATLQTQI